MTNTEVKMTNAMKAVCPRCAGKLHPWGTLLVGERTLLVLHCGDHPGQDRLWDEAADVDCGKLHDAARSEAR